MEFSIARLARESGAGERTIRDIEKGRTTSVQVATLKALAAVLEVEFTELATDTASASAAAPVRVKRGRAAVSTPPRASRLEALVALEQELRRDPRALETPEGRLEQLTPKRFQDVMTAFQLHQEARFWTVGQVMQQRGITIAEAAVLGSESGIGARFLVKIEVGKQDALFVTAYVSTAAHTLELQRKMATREPTGVALHVLVSRVTGDAVAVTVAGGPAQACTGLDASRWGGFAIFGSQTLHPWILVVSHLLDPATTPR